MTMRIPSLLAQGPESGLYMVVRMNESQADVVLDLTICEVTNAPQKSKNVVEMIPQNICEAANIIATPSLTTR